MQILRGLGPVRLAAIGLVMLGVLAFFGYLLSQTSHGNMAMLYSQLDPVDAGRIVEKLETQNVPFEIRADGTQIYVPQEKVARLRMDMAQAGLTSGGVVGNELFDRGDMLSTSGSMIDINKVRALEGELSKSIKTINGVSIARVHLVMPKRELFSKEKTEPSASILLKMKGIARLSAAQVQAIQNLVASAVPGLPTDRIAIIDDQGNLLAKTSDGSGGGHGMMMHQEVKAAYEMKTSKSLEELLAKTLGANKVRIEVAADLDFDQVTINSEKYDPDGQVVRSINNSKEDSKSAESGSQNVTVQNALPQNDSQPGGGGVSSQNRRNDDSTTYEISRVVETHHKQAGAVKNLSVAVLVDGNYTKDEKGKETYAPKSKEELEQIKMLVKSAIGFKESRGDQVEVINMKFAQVAIEEAPVESTAQSWLGKLDLTRLIELLVLAAVGILILLMIVRPVLLRVVESSGVADGDAEATALLASAQGGQAITGLPDFSQMDVNGEIANGYNADDSFIDVDNVDGRVRASSVKKISEIIDKHPEEAVVILRNWMYEEPWKQEKTISA